MHSFHNYIFNRSFKVFISILFFILFLQNIYAQNASGNWEGFLVHQSCTGSRLKLKVKLTIDSLGIGKNSTLEFLPLEDYIKDDSFSSTIWSFKVDVQFNYNEVKVSYRATDEQYGRRRNYGYYIFGSYKLLLNYSINSSTEKLIGYYAGSNGGHGKINFFRNSPVDSINKSENSANTLSQLRAKLLERKAAKELKQNQVIINETAIDTTAFFSEKFEQDTLVGAENLTQQKMLSRKSLLLDSIIVQDSNYIDISFFDAGVMDNDTISFYIDTTLILHRIVLTGKPIQIRVNKPENATQNLLSMIAENLGSIPPNTALMIIEYGKRKYKINMKSDFIQNGTLLLKWE
ncbi:MAG: hypothetical protein MUE72_12130 [Chitinophagaceae bacterium]|jgi:hypothetical protein|nr:hypothetical protein [Chitinophagaceae bacterium]